MADEQWRVPSENLEHATGLALAKDDKVDALVKLVQTIENLSHEAGKLRVRIDIINALDLKHLTGG